MSRSLTLIVMIFYQVFAVAKGGPLAAFLDDLDSFQSSFKQVLMNEYGDVLETSAGTLYLKQPGMFHWAYKSPYIQKIVSDRKSLWVFDADLEQLTIRSVTDAVNQTPAGIILGYSKLDKHFIQTDLGKIEGYDWIELTPRDPESQYKTIKIGFNQNNLGMMVVDDNLGQTTRIDFLDAVKNIDIDNSLFTLIVPAGIDIIDERK